MSISCRILECNSIEGWSNTVSVLRSSDRVRAARCAILHIKTENRAYFGWKMCDFRIYTFLHE